MTATELRDYSYLESEELLAPLAEVRDAGVPAGDDPGQLDRLEAKLDAVLAAAEALEAAAEPLAALADNPAGLLGMLGGMLGGR